MKKFWQWWHKVFGARAFEDDECRVIDTGRAVFFSREIPKALDLPQMDMLPDPEPEWKKREREEEERWEATRKRAREEEAQQEADMQAQMEQEAYENWQYEQALMDWHEGEEWR